MEETYEVQGYFSERSQAEISLNRKLLWKSDNLCDGGESNRTRECNDCMDLGKVDWKCIQTIEIRADNNPINKDKTSTQILIEEVTDRMLQFGIQKNHLPRFVVWRGSVHLVSLKGEFLLIDWFSSWRKNELFYQIIGEALERQDDDLFILANKSPLIESD